MKTRQLKRYFSRMSYLVMLVSVSIGLPGFAAVSSPRLTQLDASSPYGWHDGVEGVVGDTGSCAAFGWAVDPDNRDRDLQVRILADGSEVLKGIANLPRGDLVDECPEGTCGFGFNLWEMIDPRDEHTISVQAFDEETDLWVDLLGTPKSLTCMGYPEGSHDGAEGLVLEPWNCSAFGWAVDPDDRVTDLEVRILADGNFLVTTTADQLREDVVACEGGMCGFSVNIWDFISPDVEHQITAQARDLETAEWIDLSSAKELTCTEPPPPQPNLRVFPNADYVDGYSWPAGQLVQLEVGGKTFETTSDANGFVEFYPSDYDLQQGDTVRVSSGDLVVEHVVKMLYITEVNIETQAVAGTVNGEETVHVFSGQADRYFSSNEDGTWYVDLTGDYDPVLFPGACVTAEAWQAGTPNSTLVDWCIPVPPPNPRFYVFPEWDYIIGWEWDPGVEIYAEIDHPETPENPDCTASSQMIHPEWSEDEYVAEFFLEGECDIQHGDYVVLTDGTTPKDHTVFPLQVESYNPETDTIGGKAAANGEVQAWVHGEDWTFTTAPTDSDGNWEVNFTPFDLQEGTGGRVEQVDEDGDATSVDWSVPNPWFTVFPENEFVEGWEWPFGIEVHLTINDPGTEQEVDFEQYEYSGYAPWGSGQLWIWFEFPGEYDVKPGDIVTLSGGGYTRTHTVESLTVDAIDLSENQVAGTSADGKPVVLWSWEDPDGGRVDATVFEDKTWIADFDDIGFNLQPGFYVRAEIWDEYGNDTAVDRDIFLPIQIDIKPFSEMNQAACRFPSNLIPVAILGAEDFEASSVDPDSIRFGRTGSEAEVVRVGMDNHPMKFIWDVNRDGLTDIVYYFRLGDTGFSCADIPVGRLYVRVEGVMTGWSSEYGVEGSDILRLYRFLY
jgi:hypothetical protein